MPAKTATRKAEAKMPNNAFKDREATQHFEDEAKALLKAALAERQMTHGALVEALTKKGYPPIKEMALTMRISRGGFSAAFLLQALDAMGLELEVKRKR